MINKNKYSTEEIQSFDCICCGKTLNIQSNDKPTTDFSSLICEDGIVDKMCGGVGSKYDGDIMYFGICDKCLDKKKKDGKILIVNNYIGFDIDFDKENKEFIQNDLRKKKIKKIIKE